MLKYTGTAAVQPFTVISQQADSGESSLDLFLISDCATIHGNTFRKFNSIGAVPVYPSVRLQQNSAWRL